MVPQDLLGKVRGGVEVGSGPHGSGAVLWTAGDNPSATQNPHEDNVGISGQYPGVTTYIPRFHSEPTESGAGHNVRREDKKNHIHPPFS
jgi:hypothetical protein